MHSRLTTTRSLGTIVLSMMLLGGCALVPALKPVTATVVACPTLDAPPEAAIDALEATARRDEATAAWTIALSRHYDQLDRCNSEN